jgi:copper chaperone CopZ
MAAKHPVTVAQPKEIAEENQEPLNYKTWVLKVSIHCEGCKRKVKKILASIHGVYMTDIDLKQQQVTVTGTVDADTLINKLVKTGKHAVLLHGQNPLTDTDADHKVKKQQQTNKQKPITINQESSSSDKKNNNAAEVKLQENPSSSSLSKNESVTVVKNTEAGTRLVNGKSPADVSRDGVVKQSKAEVKQNVTGDTGNQSSVVAENKGPVKESKVGVKQNVTGDTGNQSSAVAGCDGQVKGSKNVTEDTGNQNCDTEGCSSGTPNSSGKKKKKKGQKRNNLTTMEGSSEHSAPAYTGSTQNYVGPAPMPANNSPTRHYGFESPATHYYAPPVPVVSYNTVNLGTSYGYYTSPSPYNSYAYMNPGTERDVLPSDLDSYVVTQPSDSFEVFSDENPNACSVM